ncbi:hypothetical protein [Paractinoplanes brasiliensis]|uniref:Uncharacterized protein n=1 Tax=Paractinoplanes brasiliensis TaxID=52695 RepID=A0A4R6JAB1_9ACTN|nr:hypothetical protein [Actinoplanes brasiliensis]TDO32432.1 hypothetical protein C8E87_7893 [Actinoplanes brasiliensis]GID27695.1 hypothetical protein Abr02nite_26780 [Actinoplanes brasiliensis]
MNILGVELRRSAALGAALLALTVGVIALYAAPARWSHGWLALAMTTREYTILLWPLALAAGAWQGRREHRANVGELFATTPRPRRQRMVPVLGAMAVATGLAYVLVVAAGGASLLTRSHYFSPDFLVISAVGVLSLVAAGWLGLGLGRLLPALVTAPALGVAGVLLVFFSAVANPDWLAAVLSPMYGTGQFTPDQTIDGGVSGAVAIWMLALAATGAVLLTATNWRSRVAAALPAVLGLGLATAVVPRDHDRLTSPIDPVARELVCTDDAPKVCVTRVNAGVLDELAPLAREGLAVLAELPSPPTAVQEGVTGLPAPGPGVVRIPVRIDKNGGLAHPSVVVYEVVSRLGVEGDARCPGDPMVLRAAAYWLLGREPLSDVGVVPEVIFEDEPLNAQAVRLWQGLAKLPREEASARVAAVQRAALNCQDTTGLLSRPAR